jgi:hypothetical protein
MHPPPPRFYVESRRLTFRSLGGRFTGGFNADEVDWDEY